MALAGALFAGRGEAGGRGKGGNGERGNKRKSGDGGRRNGTPVARRRDRARTPPSALRMRDGEERPGGTTRGEGQEGLTQRTADLLRSETAAGAFLLSGEKTGAGSAFVLV